MEGYTEIFSWGLDSYGQLGLGTTTQDKKYAQPIFCSFSILIRDISCGEDHSGFISDSGHVYTMGSNSNGKLGINNTIKVSSSSPCLVEELASHTCVKISCGWTTSAVITNEGILFTWGCGENGALGNSTFDDQWGPKKIAYNVSDVSCGARHMGAISYGEVFMCGAGDIGQLGTGRRQNQSQLIQIQSENAIQVSCGVFHSGYLTESGEVYMMGGNSYGQLGIGNKKSIATPTKINIREGIKLICGNSSACITADGLYIWGSSIFGENLLPTKVKISNHPIIDLAIGGCYCIAVDSKYNTYSWGSNSNGELAVGDFEQRSNPIQITSLKGKNIKKIGAGANFIICLGLSNREKKEYKSITARINNDNIPRIAPATTRDQRPVGLKALDRSTSPQNRLLTDSNKLSEKSDPRLTDRSLGRERESNRKDTKSSSILSIINSVPQANISEYENQINSLRSQNIRLKEELFKLNKEIDFQKSKDDSEQIIAKLKESYLYEIQSLKKQLDSQLMMQKELEKDLEIAVHHTSRLETALTQAQKDLAQKNLITQSELLSRIQNLEDENKSLKELVDNSDAQCKEFQHLIEKSYQENAFYQERNEDLQHEQSKFHKYIQDLQESIDNLNNIIKEQESCLVNLTEEKSILQADIFQLQEKNKQIVENFEKDVSQKAQVFKNKALNLLSGQKQTALHSNPSDKSFDEIDNPKSSRKELSNRQQTKIKNAVNRILEVNDPESPLRSIRISSPARVSPERHSPYKPLAKECSGVTPSKDDVKSKINALMQNRSRIERKLQLLQNEQDSL